MKNILFLLRLTSFSIFFFGMATVAAQEDAQLDSLIQRMEQEKNTCKKSNILITLVEHNQPKDIQKAIFYAKSGLQLATLYNCPSKGILYNHLGFLYNEEGDYNKALSYLDSALTFNQNAGDSSELLTTYGYLSIVHYYLANPSNAAFYAYKGLAINQHFNNKLESINLLNILSAVYDGQEDYPKALKVLKEALTIAEDSAIDPNYKGTLLYNVAITYQKYDQLDSALYFFQEALDLYKKNNNVYGIVTTYLEQAIIYRKQKKITAALAIMNKVTALRPYVSTMAETNITIDRTYGSIYQANKEYSKAVPFLKKALQKAKEFKRKSLELSVTLKLINCYEGMDAIELAYPLQKQVTILKDSIFNERKQKQIKSLEIKYETDKKEQENIVLKQERELIQTRAKRSQQAMLASLLILLLVVIISYLVVRNNKEKSQRKTSQLKNQLLRNQMSPHFIFNSLTAIQSFLYKNSATDSIRYLSAFAKLMRAILENSRKEYISIDKELQWLENYMKLQLLRFEDKFEYTIDLDEAIHVHDVLIPPMLSQPFIENALEHGLKSVDYKGIITIQFRIKDALLHVEIKDNGIGINNTQKQEKTSTHTSLATTITKERLDYLNRSVSQKIYFDIQAIQPHGTLVTFALPLQYA